MPEITFKYKHPHEITDLLGKLAQMYVLPEPTCGIGDQQYHSMMFHDIANSQASKDFDVDVRPVAKFDDIITNEQEQSEIDAIKLMIRSALPDGLRITSAVYALLELAKDISGDKQFFTEASAEIDNFYLEDVDSE